MTKNLWLIGLGAFAWGLVKGVAMRHKVGAQPFPQGWELVHRVAAGPLLEELIYREGLLNWAEVLDVSKDTVRTLSAVWFGIGHYPKGSCPICPNPYPIAFRLARVADATAGGLLYNEAHERGGVLASTVVHGLHNLGTIVGGCQ